MLQTDLIDHCFPPAFLPIKRLRTALPTDEEYRRNPDLECMNCLEGTEPDTAPVYEQHTLTSLTGGALATFVVFLLRSSRCPIVSTGTKPATRLCSLALAGGCDYFPTIIERKIDTLRRNARTFLRN